MAGFSFGKMFKDVGKAVAQTAEGMGVTRESIQDGLGKVQSAAAGAADAVKKQASTVFDTNGDGVFDFRDVVMLSLKLPYVRIDRAVYLKSALMDRYPASVVADVIDRNPMAAGISIDDIDSLASAMIDSEVEAYEHSSVMGIAAMIGFTGPIMAAAMAAGISVDVIQYFGYMLRTVQKLMYLYGMPELILESEDKEQMDASVDSLLLCIGMMYGIEGSDAAVDALAMAMSGDAGRRVLVSAVMSGGLVPIIRGITRKLGLRLSRRQLNGLGRRVGEAVRGEEAPDDSFRACSIVLQRALRNTCLSNPYYSPSAEAEALFSKVATEDKEDSFKDRKNTRSDAFEGEN